ncbi:MAG: FtsW/RodA/SpoVE family cell cycle protein [bacterium]|nr:FtsW/RodA/SpoVE family cell cycle protein [bacterium]
MLALFLPAGILVFSGLIAISSISLHLFWLQLLWAAMGIGIVAVFMIFDWRIILNYRWFIGGLYLVVILLLLFVYLKGPLIRNVRSWLVFGPLNFQPVELMKIVLILLYANYFSRRHLSIARWRNIFTPFLFCIVPVALVALQPDLGSAFILFGIWFGFLLLSGLPPRRVFAALAAFAFLGFLMWSNVLKDYQRERIVGVFHPDQNALGINYSAIQSKIAVGSAGFWGKGYGQGSQTQLGFLTEPANDFILAALIEEWGLFGGFIVLTGFLFLIFQILKIGASVERNFEKFICLGVAIVFGLQFLLNVGSVTGFMPVVGIPFPFLSYGGSSLISSVFLLAIVGAIGRGSRSGQMQIL